MSKQPKRFIEATKTLKKLADFLEENEIKGIFMGEHKGILLNMMSEDKNLILGVVNTTIQNNPEFREVLATAFGSALMEGLTDKPIIRRLETDEVNDILKDEKSLTDKQKDTKLINLYGNKNKA